MKSSIWYVFSLLALICMALLSGCGSGGNGGGGSQLTATHFSVSAQSNATAGTAFNFTVTALDAANNVVTTYAGTVHFTSSDAQAALPANAMLTNGTGTFSATLKTLGSQIINAADMVTASITGTSNSITVNAAVAAPSNLVYPQTAIVASVGKPIIPDIPTVTGTVISYSVVPSLPTGLSINNSTGVISGAPTAVSSSTIYTVTASNSGGNSTAEVTIAVNHAASALLELGHATQIQFIRVSNSRVLSQDTPPNNHWVLWDYAAGTMVKQGDQGGRFPVDLAGNTVVIGLANGLEVHASSDGSILSLIAAPVSWWKLATDGSYIGAGSSMGLSVWSPSGQLLFSKSGDYSAANSFAAPGQLHVALGAEGQNVIETISIGDGSSSTSPTFSGQFNSWFVDGQRFLTNVSTSVWVYSNSGTQQALVSLPTVTNLTGQGNWIWTFQNNTPGYAFNIYSIGSTTPAASFSLNADDQVIPAGTTVSILPSGTPAVTVIDLSGANPSEVNYTLPVAYPTAFGASTSTQWLVGNVYGVIFDGTSSASSARYLGFGAAWSIAGASGRTAIATANGTIFYLDPSTMTVEGTIAFSSSKVELSSDGDVLAAAANEKDAQYEQDRTLKLFSLPAGTLINSWPYTFQYVTPFLVDFSLSGSGTILGQELESLSGPLSFARQVTATTGGTTIWSDSPNGFSPIQLAPDGTLIAVSQAPPSYNSFTNVFHNGTLQTAVPGWAAGWIDNARFLVNNYVISLGASIFSGVTIYDPTGVNLANPALPELLEFQTATSDAIYSPKENTIFSLTTGSPVWTTPNPSAGVGAISGSYVVYLSGSQVLAESY